MVKREDFIRAGNVVNEHIAGSELPPDVLDAMQTLKDGCVELIRIPMWIRKHYGALDDWDGDPVNDPMDRCKEW